MIDSPAQILVMGLDAVAMQIYHVIMRELKDFTITRINPKEMIYPQIPRSGVHVLICRSSDLDSMPLNQMRKIISRLGLIIICKDTVNEMPLKDFPAAVLFSTGLSADKLADQIVATIRLLQTGEDYHSIRNENIQFYGNLNPDLFQKPPVTKLPDWESQANLEESLSLPTELVSHDYKFDINSIHVAGDFIAGDKHNVTIKGSNPLHVDAHSVHIEQKSDGKQVNINKFTSTDGISISQHAGDDQVNVNRMSSSQDGKGNPMQDGINDISQPNANQTDQKKFCKECGKRNDPESKFCHDCGMPIL